MWVSFYSVYISVKKHHQQNSRRTELTVLDSVFIIPNIQRQGPGTEEEYKLCLEAQSKANLS